jgi:hypothetical protein
VSAVHRSFGVDGIRVEVVAASHDLAAAVDGLLGGYPTSQGKGSLAPAITVELGVGGPVPRVPDGPTRFAFPPLRAYDHGGGYLLVDDVGHLQVSPADARIVGAVATTADAPACWRFVGLGLWLALLECFRARGRYMIHAAAVVDPEGQLVLLPGARGAGKSTAALSLVEAGWDTLGDDTVFVERPDGGDLVVIGHPRPFHVSDEVLSHRPRLQRLARRPPAFDPQDKWLLPVETAFPGRRRGRWQGPIRLAFPEIHDRAVSHARPLSPREALTRLFRHSAFVFAHPELAPAHLAVLGNLVDASPARLLCCGRDVFLNPTSLVGLVQEGAWHSVALA